MLIIRVLWSNRQYPAKVFWFTPVDCYSISFPVFFSPQNDYKLAFYSIIMKAYIAGKLHTKQEKAEVEKIAAICESLGVKTYLPHRDGGMCRSMKDVPGIFKADITDSLAKSDLVIANLNGLHVGAGTAWELGYAFAKGIKAIGFKTDEPPKEALEYLSAILLGSLEFVTSFDELKKEIEKFKNNLER